MIVGSSTVIGEVTVANRNVFFELGYAYGLDKRVYLVRNTTLHGETNSFLASGVYQFEYSSPRHLVELVSREDASSAGAHPDLLDKQPAEQVPGTVAVLVPDDRLHQTLFRDNIVRCIEAQGLTVVTPEAQGMALLASFRAILAAEWVVGDLVGDLTLDHERMNAATALLLGLAVARGKKVIILQQEPVAKSMIDLAGLVDRYADVAGIERILGRRLDVQSKPGIRTLERSPIEDESEGEQRALGRVEVGGDDDSNIFEEMGESLAPPPASPPRRLPDQRAPVPTRSNETEPVASRVMKIVAEQLGIDQADIRAESSLMEDLHADDLSFVELLLALEEAFELEIPDEDAEKLKTVGDLVNYVRSRTGGPSPKGPPP